MLISGVLSIVEYRRLKYLYIALLVFIVSIRSIGLRTINNKISYANNLIPACDIFPLDCFNDRTCVLSPYYYYTCSTIEINSNYTSCGVVYYSTSVNKSPPYYGFPTMYLCEYVWSIAIKAEIDAVDWKLVHRVIRITTCGIVFSVIIFQILI